MDPNAALERIREITRGYNDPDSEDFNAVPGVDDLVDYAQQLTELVDGLDEWLTKGGFVPEAWEEQRKKDDVRECPGCLDMHNVSLCEREAGVCSCCTAILQAA